MNDVTDERPDAELLEDFTRNRSEAAFAAIVGRYVGLVHSVALRHTAVPEQTQDITQAVFIILARKAGSLGRKTVLSGWLYHTARLTAANYQRAESRRIRREQEAYMQSIMEAGATPVWDEVSPQLDGAMAKLGTADRDALVLRYFENQSLTQVGAALGIEERAAQKRVGRALEKLRKFFARRGVTLSAAVIAGVLSANAVQAAPAGLAVTTAAAATGGLTISATITTLINETMKTMTWLKIKFAAGVGVAALLAAGTATVAISRPAAGDGAMKPAEILAKTHAAYAALSSYRDDGKVIANLGKGEMPPTRFNIKLARPGFYRVEWDQDLGVMDVNGAVWSAGMGDYFKRSDSSKTGDSREQYPDRRAALSRANGNSNGAAESIPGIFFNVKWGTPLETAWNSPARQADAKIGAVDCYVLTTSDGGSKQTLWIGKSDFLIRQQETDLTPEARAAEAAELEAKVKKDPQLAKLKTTMQELGEWGNRDYSSYNSIETHEHIVVNGAFAPADFAVEAGK